MNTFTNRIIQESYQKVYRKNRFLKSRTHVYESEDTSNKLIYDESDPICVKLGFRKYKYNNVHYCNIENNKRVDYIYIGSFNNDKLACFASDNFLWFDMETGDRTDPPREIEGDFNCSKISRYLTSLDGAPEKVVGNFYCYECEDLTSLYGAPRYVNGDFNCIHCEKLHSLEGAPMLVGGDFDCSRCPNLTSLHGSPREVGGDFNCYECGKLTSLMGSPREVGGDFNCSSTNILRGIPDHIGGKLILPFY